MNLADTKHDVFIMTKKVKNADIIYISVSDHQNARNTKKRIQMMSRRHKDINKAHSLLYGEGWHIIETGQRKTNRRDKRRCVHYNNKLKSYKLNCICLGSSGCPCYREY